MSQKSTTSRSRGLKANGTVRQKKEFGAKRIEAKVRKSVLPLFYVTAVVVVILCPILCCCGSPKQQLSQFGINICTAMFYLICAKELYIFGRQWAAGLILNRSKKDNLVQMFLIPGVVVTLQFSGSYDTRDKYRILHILLTCALVVSKVFILFVLKVNRNNADSTRIVERMPNAVGPGLARCFFSYLENVIQGKCGSPRYNDAINMYRQEEGIPDGTMGKDWILNKVMILFPEARESRGSVEELVQKFDKDRKSKKGAHRLCFEKIKHEYEVNGQKRKSWLEVLKLYDGDVVGYVVIAENRPLNTLYSMVEQNEISEEAFKIQFHAYKNELKRILDESKECKGNYEFFHYKDSRLCDFGSAVIAKIRSMRLKELD